MRLEVIDENYTFLYHLPGKVLILPLSCCCPEWCGQSLSWNCVQPESSCLVLLLGVDLIFCQVVKSHVW